MPMADARALAIFERGMAGMQKHSYQAAAESFRQLIDQFPGERALLERTRVYLELCERELRRQPAAPRTVEERLTAATAALNNDDDAVAERLVRLVLDSDGDHDLALYLMAAVEARRGDPNAALSYLTRAVGSSPEVRAQAKHDGDFESLRGLDAFKALIDPPAGAPGMRRFRRR
jgi:Tfp pilus assembly protein PilF